MTIFPPINRASPLVRLIKQFEPSPARDLYQGNRCIAFIPEHIDAFAVLLLD